MIRSRQLALLLQGRASECFRWTSSGSNDRQRRFHRPRNGRSHRRASERRRRLLHLHGVTLGATGKKDKKTGRRHPIVGSGCTLGSCASVLGPITVGDGATIGANAIVTKNVEAGATVIETGFMNNRVLGAKKPKA